jgi:heme-degrading monooxygenase HmoA
VHAVLFRFQPYPEQCQTYFSIVAELRPELQKIEGFLHNERFESEGQPGILLSLSLWEDEAAILRWRRHAGHLVAQRRGKSEVFADYRLRVGQVVEDETADLRLTIGHRLPDRGERFQGLAEPERKLVVLPGLASPAEGSDLTVGLRILRDYGPRGPIVPQSEGESSGRGLGCGVPS